MTARHAPRRAAAVAAVCVALFVSACGEAPEDDAADTADDRGAGEEATGATGVEAAFPVTVEHAYGTTEVEAPPERIVSLDFQWTDVLAALDHPPAAYLVDPTIGEAPPWVALRLGRAEVLRATTELPLEAVAAAEPDLIVVTYLAVDRADYEALSGIAPTMPSLNPDRVETWQELTTLAGDVLGVPDEAAALIDEVDGAVAAVAEELPELDGRTVAMANYVPGDGIYVVSDPEDGANRLFADLGLEIAPAILEQAGTDLGRVQISFERIDLLDTDLLVMLFNGADPDEVPGYAELPAVRDGAAAELDHATIVGLNTPSPLSIPYSLEAIRPQLEAAAA